MPTEYTEYPTIHGTQPKLLNETGVRELPNYPDHETYVCRGIYEFDEYDITVTIRPYIPNEKMKEWANDPEFDPESVTGPDGWKIAVAAASNALHSADGDRVYDTPGEAINAVRAAEHRALTDLQEDFNA